MGWNLQILLNKIKNGEVFHLTTEHFKYCAGFLLIHFLATCMLIFFLMKNRTLSCYFCILTPCQFMNIYKEKIIFVSTLPSPRNLFIIGENSMIFLNTFSRNKTASGNVNSQNFIKKTMLFHFFNLLMYTIVYLIPIIILLFWSLYQHRIWH